MFDKSAHVYIDTAEKAGQFVFPKYIRYQWGAKQDVLPVTYSVEALNESSGRAGDYTLAGYERITAIERKRDVPEVYKNVTDDVDRPRFLAALDRLALVRHPWLVLGFNPSEFCRPHPYITNPTDALDRLLRECMLRGIPVVSAPETRNPLLQGSFVLRLLLTGSCCRHKITGSWCSCSLRDDFVKQLSKQRKTT